MLNPTTAAMAKVSNDPKSNRTFESGWPKGC
jgi:hypothetical protein